MLLLGPGRGHSPQIAAQGLADPTWAYQLGGGDPALPPDRGSPNLAEGAQEEGCCLQLGGGSSYCSERFAVINLRAIYWILLLNGARALQSAQRGWHPGVLSDY